MNIGGWILAAIGLVAAITFVRLIKLYISIITRKFYWRRLARKDAAKDSILLVIIGDSIAQGIGASSARKGVMGLVIKSITQLTKRPVKVVNLSVTNAQIDAVRDKQLPQLNALDLKPDIFIVEAGANNLRDFTSAAEFRKEYVSLLNKLPKQAIIVDIPYFGDNSEKKVSAMNKVVHAEASRRGMAIASVHQSIYQRRSRRNYGADFIHPNNRGYRAWYAGIWPIVESRLKQKNLVN